MAFFSVLHGGCFYLWYLFMVCRNACVTYIKFRVSQEQGSDNWKRQYNQEPSVDGCWFHITLEEIDNGQNTKDYFCYLQVYPILIQPEVRHGHNNKLQYND